MEVTHAVVLPSNLVWVADDLGVATVRGFLRPPIVAPQEWTQYDKPCETCNGTQYGDEHQGQGRCPDCRDGRQVWEMQWSNAEDDGSGRATIQVVPVISWMRNDDVQPNLSLAPNGAWLVFNDFDIHGPMAFDPWPVSRRDFAIIVRRCI